MVPLFVVFPFNVISFYDSHFFMVCIIPNNNIFKTTFVLLVSGFRALNTACASPPLHSLPNCAYCGCSQSISSNDEESKKKRKCKSISF